MRDELAAARKRLRVSESGRRHAEGRLADAFAFRERLHANLLRAPSASPSASPHVTPRGGGDEDERQWVQMLEIVSARAEEAASRMHHELDSLVRTPPDFPWPRGSLLTTLLPCDTWQVLETHRDHELRLKHFAARCAAPRLRYRCDSPPLSRRLAPARAAPCPRRHHLHHHLHRHPHCFRGGGHARLR